MHHTIVGGPLSSYKEFRAYKPQKVPASWNWCLFRSFVVGRHGKTCEQMCPMEDVFDVAQDYYDLASKKVDRTLRADKLSTKCLHAMVRFGDVILEDISLEPTSHASQVGTDLDDHYTDEFDRMVCLYGASDRTPVIINGRLSTEHDFSVVAISNGTLLPLTPKPDNNLVEACKEANVPVLQYFPESHVLESLSRWRNTPLNTVFLMQIMDTEDSMEPADLDILCQYGETVLRASPERSAVFGVATNLRTCRFTAVTFNIRPDGLRRYRAYCSELITENVTDELARFVATSPEAHGHQFTFPVTHFVPHEYLGTGSTGTVIAGKWSGDSADRLLALKISIYPDALKLERVILGYLERLGVQHVPRIDHAAQESLSQPALCGAFCNVYTERFLPLEALTLDHAKTAWAVLEALHVAHIVHRDVRAPNIMISICPPMRVVWVDFSSARVIAGQEEQAGVFVGTSHEELQSLYENRPVNTASDAVLRGADTLPADEGCAMIYCVLQHLFQENDCLTHMLPHDKQSFIRDRSEAFDVYELCPRLAPYIARIEAALTMLGARRVSLTTEEIRAKVHAGLAAAYGLQQEVLLAEEEEEVSPLEAMPAGDIKRRRTRPPA